MTLDAEMDLSQINLECRIDATGRANRLTEAALSQIDTATASIKKPIHNVKDADEIRGMPPARARLQLRRTVFAFHLACHVPRQQRTGGAYRDRTDDLMLAKQALSQLS